MLIPFCILYSKSNTSVDNLLQFPSKRQRRTTYKILHAQMAETQPQPNLEIFSLTFDGYIDASKPRGKRTSTLKGTRNEGNFECKCAQTILGNISWNCYSGVLNVEPCKLPAVKA